MIKNLWIIGICNTDGEGVELETVIGTDEEIKDYLLLRLNEHREEDNENYDYGSETVDDIASINANNGYYAYAVYSSYHIDYTAVRAISLTPKTL